MTKLLHCVSWARANAGGVVCFSRFKQAFTRDIQNTAHRKASTALRLTMSIHQLTKFGERELDGI